MNLIFYICVFSCFSAIGYYIWRGYSQRKIFFENLLSFCNHLLVEISFSKNTIIHIIDTYSANYSRQFSEVLLKYKKLLIEKQDITRERIESILWNRLKFHERGAVCEFFYELGRHGSAEETEKTQNKKLQFDSFFQASLTALKKDASIYLKVFILLGIGAVILLL